ncbi:hypothetical protein BC834DRAFT_969239 [Gloeopeniophorella convolvens]|nr:hypothetical protein BC834DRAFT_969239 [Gloeopeniophorella convolvens]
MSTPGSPSARDRIAEECDSIASLVASLLKEQLAPIIETLREHARVLDYHTALLNHHTVMAEYNVGKMEDLRDIQVNANYKLKDEVIGEKRAYPALTGQPVSLARPDVPAPVSATVTTTTPAPPSRPEPDPPKEATAPRRKSLSTPATAPTPAAPPQAESTHPRQARALRRETSTASSSGSSSGWSSGSIDGSRGTSPSSVGTARTPSPAPAPPPANPAPAGRPLQRERAVWQEPDAAWNTVRVLDVSSAQPSGAPSLVVKMGDEPEPAPAAADAEPEDTDAAPEPPSLSTILSDSGLFRHVRHRSSTPSDADSTASNAGSSPGPETAPGPLSEKAAGKKRMRPEDLDEAVHAASSSEGDASPGARERKRSKKKDTRVSTEALVFPEGVVEKLRYSRHDYPPTRDEIKLELDQFSLMRSILGRTGRR